MTPITELRKVHEDYWRSNQDVSKATKAAIRITREWQDQVIAKAPHFAKEFPVAGLGERIDLLDTTARVAYELKVSPNNTHMEFYRDVFKILAHNEASKKSDRILRLIFITPKAGATKLSRGLGQAACRISEKFGFTVEVMALEK